MQDLLGDFVVRRLLFAALPNQEYHLAIAGSMDSRFTPKLQQQARELGIAHRVEWLDYLDYQDLPLIICGAIALVFPTLWEGFGLPVLEAMACGTPVITSNLASLPEIVGDAYEGGHWLGSFAIYALNSINK